MKKQINEQTAWDKFQTIGNVLFNSDGKQQTNSGPEQKIPAGAQMGDGSTYGSLTSNNPTIPQGAQRNFGCVESVHPTGRAYTTSKHQLHINRSGGIVHIFKNDGNFTYRSGNTRHDGTWLCDGASGYKITLKNGQTFSSKDGKWSSVSSTPAPAPPNTTPAPPNTTPAPITGGGTTPTTLTPDDLINGKFVKMGMKGDIIGKIQELLISKGYKDISKDGKVDKIFGRRTKKMVKNFQSANKLEDDGAVGPLTWGKLNDSSAVSASASTSTSTTNTSTAATEKIPVISGSDAILF
jgi:hypothetical protein